MPGNRLVLKDGQTVFVAGYSMGCSPSTPGTDLPVYFDNMPSEQRTPTQISSEDIDDTQTHARFAVFNGWAGEPSVMEKIAAEINEEFFKWANEMLHLEELTPAEVAIHHNCWMKAILKGMELTKKIIP